MIGLTIITQIVYWYRDLKTPGLTASERRQPVKVEMKKITVPTSTTSSSIVDYLTPYEQPWTDMGNLDWNSYDKRIEVQERMEINSQDVGPVFPQRPESNFNGSALGNPEPMELHSYDRGAKYSECSACNTNGSALENPDRMEWNSYDSGVRLTERPNWIENELSKSELSEFSVTKQFVVPDTKTNPEEDHDNERRRRWERNEMDYMGQDSFQNILAKLEKSLTD